MTACLGGCGAEVGPGQKCVACAAAVVPVPGSIDMLSWPRRVINAPGGQLEAAPDPVKRRKPIEAKREAPQPAQGSLL